MRRGEVKFISFVLWLILSVAFFSIIFLYIKFYSNRDTIINFVPAGADYYIHLDIRDYQKNKIKENLASELMDEAGFSQTLIDGILPGLKNEIALVYLPDNSGSKKILFLRTNQRDKIINLLDIAHKEYVLISPRLLAVGQDESKIDFSSKKNLIFSKLNQIKFSGRILYWGFIAQDKFADSMIQKNSHLQNFISQKSDNQDDLVFVSQLSKEKIRFRIGIFKEIEKINGLEDLSNDNQLEKLKPLNKDLNPDTKLALVVDNSQALQEYAGDQFLDLLIEMKKKYMIDDDLLDLLQDKWQFNIIDNKPGDNYLLIWQLEEANTNNFVLKIERALKKIIILTHPQEEKIELPDKTMARQLVAPIEDLVREESMVGEHKIVTLKLPAENFELAYLMNGSNIFISNSKKVLIDFLKAEETIDFNQLIEENLIWSGGNTVYLHDSFLENLPVSIYPLDFKNLIISNVEKKYFRGLEGCFF